MVRKLFVKSAENLIGNINVTMPMMLALGVCARFFYPEINVMPTTSSSTVVVISDVTLQTQDSASTAQTDALESEVLDIISDIASAVVGESAASTDEGVVIVVSCGDLSSSEIVSNLPAPIGAPDMEEGQHPPYSLTVLGNLIRTIGGYAIEILAQYSWKIMGPDDTYTIISQDPNVTESDGGAWDFMRDSSFVLGDGTRINVSVTSLENGATVTSQLEIICGVDYVQVTGIDKGIGQIGNVTQDGLERLNNFYAEDTFIAGNTANIWLYFDDEIIGNYNNGTLFKLRGLELRWLQSFFDNIANYWQETWRPNMFGCNPYYEQDYPSWESAFADEKIEDNKERQAELRYELQKLLLEYDSNRHLEFLRQSFETFSNANESCSDYLNLSRQFASLRNRSIEV